jgi:hypothetical protein
MSAFFSSILKIGRMMDGIRTPKFFLLGMRVKTLISLKSKEENKIDEIETEMVSDGEIDGEKESGEGGDSEASFSSREESQNGQNGQDGQQTTQCGCVRGGQGNQGGHGSRGYKQGGRGSQGGLVKDLSFHSQLLTDFDNQLLDDIVSSTKLTSAKNWESAKQKVQLSDQQIVLGKFFY